MYTLFHFWRTAILPHLSSLLRSACKNITLYHLSQVCTNARFKLATFSNFCCNSCNTSPTFQQSNTLKKKRNIFCKVLDEIGSFSITQYWQQNKFRQFQTYSLTYILGSTCQRLSCFSWLSYGIPARLSLPPQSIKWDTFHLSKISWPNVFWSK